MADSVVSFLLDNLSRLVEHEAKLLSGVEDKVKSLQRELQMILLFLETSKHNKRKNEIEQEVLRQITDVAHEAEDVIDTFIASVAKHQRRIWLSKKLHGVDQAKLRHQVAEKIESIQGTIKEIRDNKIKYNIEQVGSSSDQELLLLHKRRRDVEEEDVVGFDHHSAEIINQLVKGDSCRKVVSIIGMGGLGKTTLARKIYNSHDVKDYFHCRGWVSVSNDYRPKELLLALLKCLKPISTDRSYNNNSRSKHKKKSKSKGKTELEDESSLSMEELKDKVRECLEGKRYIVVLDDIWEAQHWHDVHHAFPDDNKDSRILITSRITNVASHANSSLTYFLPILNKDESWELFSKKVFRGEDMPFNLEPLGRQMAESCDGLPLTIVVLAGILVNREKSHREWSKIMGHVNSFVNRPETKVKDIVFKLSYDSLPLELKPCFLYCGMFPEDFEIRVRHLVQLWVAEGFISQIDSRIAEDVAEDYLNELINRSLIQVGRRGSDGGIKTCRIHDLLRDLCIRESMGEKFFEVCGEADILKRTKPRRLSIQCRMSDYVGSSNKDHSVTRSLVCFDEVSYEDDSINLKWLVKGFQLVRVLDLGVAETPYKFPTNLQMLMHLRYLRINIGKLSTVVVEFKFVRMILASICNLWNLETLYLGRCGGRYETVPFSSGMWRLKNLAVTLPGGMWRLKNLRHIHVDALLILPAFPNAESKIMWNLQTLCLVAIKEQSVVWSLIEKGIFPKLRKLRLWFCGKREQGSGHVWQSLQRLNFLKSLTILGFPNIPTSANTFPLNLTKLTIIDMSLNNDSMSTLGNLTSLRILKLDGCRFSENSMSEAELCCSIGFPQLEVFQVGGLNVCNWKLGKDVMPCLRRLIIDQCCKLSGLPNELWCLTALREVQVIWPSKELKEHLKSVDMREGCNLLFS